MNKIYNKLKYARPIKKTESERFYTMLNPRYKLTIYYLDKTDEVLIFNGGAVRYLGRPDWFTVSNKTRADRIITFLEKITGNN